MFASANKYKRIMAAARSGGNIQGNNKLLWVAGTLFLLLILLIWIGPGENSGIGQLLSAAAPDSSNFIADTTSYQPDKEKTYAEFPERATSDSSITSQPSSDTEIDSIPETAATPEPEQASPGLKVADANGTILNYKIKKGDTFFKIAAMFGNKPADLQELNAMEDMNLQADKNIRVKIKAMHNVGQGEGINAISEKYGVSVRSIKVANGLSADALPSGSSLIIPLK